jgi:FixJ family two-component response regulator
MSSRATFVSTDRGVDAPAETQPLVIIVDDDVSVRESLAPLLELQGWRTLGFASASAFLEWETKAPAQLSCLLLDVSLPDLNGLELQNRIAGRRGEMPIIFLTGYGDVPMTVRAMKAGAAEFLTKPFDDAVLLTAVQRALEDSERLMSLKGKRKVIEDRYAALSRREREVMHLIVAGLLNKQVGGELGISEITVKAHRGRLMSKMKARSFAELVKMSQALGIDTTERR